jgi:hypothetical protein
VSNEPTPWSSPSGAPASANDPSFVASVALGGAAPVAVVEEHHTDLRELFLATILFGCALAAGGASLASWRDYGVRLDPSVAESGWVQADGSIGRGWAAVALAVLLAVAGILVAVHRGRQGRRLAAAAGVALVLLSVVEFGLGAGRLRTGPGIGLWVELVVGIVVVAAVGMLGPSTDN